MVLVATHSRLEPIREFAWMIRRHEENILTWFHMPINNGSVEGLNNKAKVGSHKAYGFRTADHFICNLSTARATYRLRLPCTDLCEEPDLRGVPYF